MNGGGPPVIEDDCERGIGFVAASWVLAGLSVIAVLLRLYSRIRLRPFCGTDDLFILFAVCLGVAGAASITVQVHYGFGRHFNALSEHNKQQAVKWEYVVEVLAFIAVFFVRTSVCFFVMRLSKLSTASRWPTRAAILAMMLSFISTMTSLIAFSVQCRPLTDAWSSNPLQCILDHYQSMVQAMTAANVLDAVANAVVLVLPALLLRGRTFTFSQKLHLATIWVMGFIPFASSVARIQLLTQNGDVTHDYLGPAYLGTCQEFFGIIAASLPCLKPLFYSTWPSDSENDNNDNFPESPLSLTTNGSLFNVNVKKKDGLTRWDSPKASRPWHRFGSVSFIPSEKRPSFPWSEDPERNDSLADFPDLVPQIGRSSVVKRMDVQVELSRATDSEVALTDKELYASWEDPPDDPDAIEPLGSSHNVSTFRPGYPTRLNVPRRCTTAVAEALESRCPRAAPPKRSQGASPPIVNGARDAARRWFRG